MYISTGQHKHFTCQHHPLANTFLNLWSKVPQISVSRDSVVFPYFHTAGNESQTTSRSTMWGFLRMCMSSLCCTLCPTFTLNATSNKTMFPKMCGSLASDQWLWYISPTWFTSTCNVLSNIYTALPFPTLPGCWRKKNSVLTWTHGKVFSPLNPFQPELMLVHRKNKFNVNYV